MAQGFDALREAFTLFEISVYLIITGLVLGAGVLTRDLIHVAELRAQAEQIRQYEQAMRGFDDKFAGLPGDLRYATLYFSGAHDGDGNGAIEMYAEGVPLWQKEGELPQALMQLSESGFVSASFDGSASIGKGVPATILNDRAGFFIASNDFFVGGYTDTASALYQENVLWFVACNADSSGRLPQRVDKWFMNCAVFSPEELRVIDAKIDDEGPQSGRLRAFGGQGSGDCVLRKAYNAESKRRVCHAAYVMN